ncbi:zf-HC2 domain-containing protein [candidate division FCPU426 bacterium]|nr:zf-HC2 domain-containing protein [candidate division FCPU426 bacterium]
MKCAQAEKWLAEKALGLITPVSAAALAGHLAECPDCRRLAEEMTAAAAALREPAAAAVPPFLADRIVQLARERQNQARRMHSGIKWLTALAGAAAVAAFLFLVPRYFPTPAPVMSAEEVLKAYSDDFSALGWLDEGEENMTFDYGNYGIPEELSQYMI